MRMSDWSSDVFSSVLASATSCKAPYSAARRQWLTTIDGHRQEWDALVAPGFSDESSPIAPQRAAREIELAVPDDAIVVSDIGIHHNWLIQYFRAARPDSLIGSMGFGPMGFGVAGVLGELGRSACRERVCQYV